MQQHSVHPVQERDGQSRSYEHFGNVQHGQFRVRLFVRKQVLERHSRNGRALLQVQFHHQIVHVSAS